MEERERLLRFFWASRSSAALRRSSSSCFWNRWMREDTLADLVSSGSGIITAFALAVSVLCAYGR